jgi:putative effector of murein hydrolase LrgA (UPF0299 family)
VHKVLFFATSEVKINKPQSAQSFILRDLRAFFAPRAVKIKETAKCAEFYSSRPLRLKLINRKVRRVLFFATFAHSSRPLRLKLNKPQSSQSFILRDLRAFFPPPAVKIKETAKFAEFFSSRPSHILPALCG